MVDSATHFESATDTGEPDNSPGLAAPLRDEKVSSPLTIGLIRNPKSHRNKGLAPEGRSAETIVAEPASQVELEAALSDFARRGIDILAISGGDGTIREVLSCGARVFAGRWPTVAVLPQGKTNALASDLGIKRQWTLADAMTAARHGRLATRRPLLVEPADGSGRSQLGFFLCAGVFNHSIAAGQVAHKYGAFQGFAVAMTALFSMLSALFGTSANPWRKLWRIDLADARSNAPIPDSGRGAPGMRFLAGFTTLDSLPLGLRPFARYAGLGAVRYFLLDAPSRRAIALVPAAAVGWRGALFERLGLQRGGNDEIRLELGEEFILDGEHFPAGAYKLSAGPELQFVTP